MRIFSFISLTVIGSLIVSSMAFASYGPNSMFNRKTKSGQNLYQVILQQGVAGESVNLLFRMFDYNYGRIPNTKTAAIVDYSLDSTEKRLYFLHLDTGVVERFYVSHGINSGVLETRSFSNLMDSWKSSLGFYYAKGSYNSAKNGPSLKLEGIDNSNNNAKDRLIVLHGAKYVSDDFIQRNGRLGWSQGCFAVALDVLPTLLNSLQSGSLLLSYHRDLWRDARQYPSEQDLTGSEIVPPGVNATITPEEQVDPTTPADEARELELFHFNSVGNAVNEEVKLLSNLF
ncbi:murein L,D-transpeptidase catalytic domain-containing protein [Bdellovibrio sp. HCB209]|uniref:murein L,D-transpeptidase catalytic domain-containing protein n=1 Tax=Bdellovibrio sp. HCB209 TaxID=3394354 RepID=UPI0039B39448